MNRSDEQTIPYKGLVLSLLLIIPFTVFGSDNDEAGKEDRKPKFYAGGNLGLQFGNVTLVDASPWLSYRPIQQLAFGIGGTYKYYRYNLLDRHVTRSYYGGRVFSRYYPKSQSIDFLNAFFLHAEYEKLKLSFGNQEAELSDQDVEALFGGIGYQIPLGRFVYGDIYLLYDFIKSGYSPYENPVLRVGVSVGL